MDLDQDARGWNEALHMRGYHGKFSYSGGRRRNWSPFEQRAHAGMNQRGHEIMRGFGSTERLHGGPFNYSPARTDVHRHIVYSETAGKPAGLKKPRALFTSGGAASGKSWLTNNRAPKGAVISDADRVKTGGGTTHGGLPEYRRLTSSGNHEVAASAAHEESSHVAKQVAEKAIERRQHLVVDGVGDSGPEKFASKIRAAQAAGYHVSVEHMHLDMQTARQREQKRSEKPGGRKVDPGALEEGHRGSAANMAHVAKIPGVHVTIWSSKTAQGAPPIKVASGVGGPRGIHGLTVHHPGEFESFKRKAGVQ